LTSLIWGSSWKLKLDINLIEYVGKSEIQNLIFVDIYYLRYDEFYPLDHIKRLSLNCQDIDLKWLMSSPKDELFRRIWVRFLAGTILGQTLLTSRPNSGLPLPLPLGTRGLIQKKNNILFSLTLISIIYIYQHHLLMSSMQFEVIMLLDSFRS
jgi:hypothetical protein